MKNMKFYTRWLVGSLLIITLGTSLAAIAATMPSEPDMKTKLMSVLDETRIDTEFYPQLLSHAGEKMSPQEIADMFNQATEQFLGDMTCYESNLVRVQLVPYIRPFIKALLEDDPEEAIEAIQIFSDEQPRLWRASKS